MLTMFNYVTIVLLPLIVKVTATTSPGLPTTWSSWMNFTLSRGNVRERVLKCANGLGEQCHSIVNSSFGQVALEGCNTAVGNECLNNVEVMFLATTEVSILIFLSLKYFLILLKSKRKN